MVNREREERYSLCYSKIATLQNGILIPGALECVKHPCFKNKGEGYLWLDQDERDIFYSLETPCPGAVIKLTHLLHTIPWPVKLSIQAATGILVTNFRDSREKMSMFKIKFS